MGEKAADRAAAVQTVLTATGGQPPNVVEQALGVVGKPGQTTTNTLWIMFVASLVVGLLASVGALVRAILDGDSSTAPDDVLKIFTPLLTGLIGLFVKSPAQ